MISVSITRFPFPSLPKPNPNRLHFLPYTTPPKCRNVESLAATSGEDEVSTSGDETALRNSPNFANIKAAKRVVLVRHGQSTWNAEGRIQGSSDYSVLTPKGEAQAETSRLMLVDDIFNACFSSPLKRSKRTAEIIWGNREETILTDYDMREIDLYSFQGLLKHEGKERFGDSFRQWQIDAPNFVIDGHYPVRELWARARNCWDRILEHDGRSVLLVAHNAVNQALVATAIGLGTDYFRILLQSNCGVSVLDFTPSANAGSPRISLNRLNQTPSSPLAGGSSGGRKTSQRIILVCHGAVLNGAEVGLPNLYEHPMNILGDIQAQKTAEFLLDANINTIVTSPGRASKDTAVAISRVQEAADCLGADCVPRYVGMEELNELNVESILMQPNKFDSQSTSMEGLEDGAVAAVWDQTGNAWQSILDKLSSDSNSEPQTVAVVGHPSAHIALLTHCLNLTENWLNSFHVDEGSVSVIDFPDGPAGRGTVRCINYTAHLGRWSIPITKPSVDDVEFY